jgi:hypothetical protein
MTSPDTAPATTAGSEGSRAGSRGPRRVRAGAVIAVGIAAAVGAFLWIHHNGGGSSSSAIKTIKNAPGVKGPVGGGDAKTVPVSEQGLETLAGALAQPIFWAGAKPGYHLELTRETDGRVFIRYLPRGVKVGSDRSFVTVGTYPLQGAFSVTKTVAARPTSVDVAVQGGGVAFYARSDPTNVYIAYPSYDAQIEVYDPWAAGARKIVTSGSVAPVPGKTPASGLTTAPQALTLSGLRSFARKLHHVLYWIGPKTGTTYEVTQTTDGKTFLRYLPAGTRVGTGSPFLTVGTYPVSGAFADVQRVATGADAVRLAVKNGAIAVYARSRPTNVYAAYPKVGYEVEIYDPNAAAAHFLVTSGRVVPVP